MNSVNTDIGAALSPLPSTCRSPWWTPEVARAGPASDLSAHRLDSSIKDGTVTSRAAAAKGSIKQHTWQGLPRRRPVLEAAGGC